MTRKSQFGLENHGLVNLSKIHWTLPAASLYEEAVKRGEASISEHGVLIAHTGEHTGRSAKDKFIVREPSSEDQIWWGDINIDISPENFDKLHKKMCDYFEGKDMAPIMWEQDPMRSLVTDNELVSYKHNGFWKCMDILRDKVELEKMWASGKPAWKIW